MPELTLFNAISTFAGLVDDFVNVEACVSEQGFQGVSIHKVARHRREIRAPRSPDHRARRRRCHADEQYGRADHCRKILEEVSRRRFIICVFNNQDLNQVTWEQRVMEGDPKFEASQDIPDVLLYHRFAAEGC